MSTTARLSSKTATPNARGSAPLEREGQRQGVNSILERGNVIGELDGGDVVGEVDQQTGVFVVRASQAKGVCNAKRFLFHHVVDALAGQSGAHVLGRFDR